MPDRAPTLDYRLIADNSHDWEFWLAPEGHFLYCSPSSLWTVGRAPEEFLADPDLLLKILHPDDRQTCAEHLHGVLHGHEPGLMEFRVIRPDGEIVWIEHVCRPVHDAEGRYLGLRGSNRDITAKREAERALQAAYSETTRLLELADNSRRALLSLAEDQRMAQEALRGSEERFRRLVEGISDIVYEYSTRRGALYWSPRVQAVLGYSLELMQRQPTLWYDSIHPEDRPAVEAAMARAASAGAIELEYRIRDLNGTWHWLDDRAQGRPGAGEEIIVTGVAREITEQKRAEEGLRQAQRLEMMGQLAGGLAHDFNNLLGIVIGNLDFLALMSPDDPEMRERIANATRASLRASELTGQLLGFARSQPGDPQILEINRAIHGMRERIAHSIAPKVRLALQLEPGAWHVNVELEELEETLLNLAVNARDAMPEGGTLTIATANRTLEPDYFGGETMAAGGEYLELTLSDTGTGIAPAVLKRIFDPFFTTKPKGKGTGLGLSMVYGFIRRSGGHIRVESEPGRGSSFRLYLPRAAGEEAKDRPAPESAPPAGANETILVVDDEAGLRDLAADQLQSLGYRTLTACNAAQALERLAGPEPIDLLFSDVVMPGGMDGQELAVRAVKLHPGLRVLLTSGYTRRGEGTSFELLDKPYTNAELARRIRRILDGG